MGNNGQSGEECALDVEVTLEEDMISGCALFPNGPVEKAIAFHLRGKKCPTNCVICLPFIYEDEEKIHEA